jgi:rod shape-determining protein MreC
MKKGNRIAFGVLAVVVIALGVSFTPVMTHIRNRAWDIVVQSVTSIFHIKNTSSSQSLDDKLKQLTLDNIRLHSELNDYARLRDHLKAPAFDSMNSIPAHVISRPIDTLQSEYIINKGLSEGISEGNAVVVHGSALIGFISQVSLHSAVIQTVFHPKTSITAETVVTDSGKDPARGLITSVFQTSLKMGTIPRDATISTGQNVVTTSNGNLIPYGIVIGTVSVVSKPENEAYQQAVIQLPYNPDTVEAVTVLTPK